LKIIPFAECSNSEDKSKAPSGRQYGNKKRSGKQKSTVGATLSKNIYFGADVI